MLLAVDLQPKMRGWLLASVDGQKAGIVPANYVRVLGKKRGRKHVPSANESREQRPLAAPMGGANSSLSRPNTDTSRVSAAADLEQTYTEVCVDVDDGSSSGAAGATIVANINDRTASEILDHSEHRGDNR